MNQGESTKHSLSPLISAWFVLSGYDFDVDECSRIIGLPPTEVWTQKHKMIRANYPEMPTTSWDIGEDKAPHYSIEEPLRVVVDRILPYRDRIVLASERLGLNRGFSVFVWIEEDRPLYELSPQIMFDMAQFQARFSMDIYDYSK